MAYPNDCYIYLDTDNQFFIYSTDPTVITIDFYDGDLSTNNGWHGRTLNTTAGSGTWGAGYVSWAVRSEWIRCDSYPNLQYLQGRVRKDYTGDWKYSTNVANPLYVPPQRCPTPSISGSLTSDKKAYCSLGVGTGYTGHIHWARYNADGSLNNEATIDSTSTATIDVDSGGHVTFYGWQTKTGWIDSYTTSTIRVDRPIERPPYSNLFSFYSDQNMTSQNLVKVSNLNYTCDAIVMPYTTWNAFADNVAAVRQYRGYVVGTKPYVSSGQVFTATVYNNMADYISQAYPGGYMIPHVASNVDNITADLINLLEDKLNEIN